MLLAPETNVCVLLIYDVYLLILLLCKEKRDAKLLEKQRKKEAQRKKQEIKELNDDIEKFEHSLRHSSTAGQIF